MIRLAGLLAMLLLGGCGLLQVGERAIPSVAGAVATTAWQAQDVSPVTDEEEAGLNSPEAYLAFVVSFAEAHGGLGEFRSGILSRDGDEAVAYLQQKVSTVVPSDLLAREVRLTMERRADGSWTLAAIETREVCAVALTAGSCGDTRGG